MIFKQEMVDAILSGRKTVTRRLVKTMVGEVAKWDTRPEAIAACRYEVRGGPGGTYALQGPPEKGSKARARTIPGYRLRILSVRSEFLRQITEAEAEREGFRKTGRTVDATARAAFLCYWRKLYGDVPVVQPVWRIEFELVPSAPEEKGR